MPAPTWFHVAMHREPVVMWSLFLGALGMALPIVVPRDAFARPETRARNPPSAADVVAALRPGRA